MLRVSKFGTTLNFLACLLFRKALAFHRHIRFVKVVVQHFSSLLVENFQGTLSDKLSNKLSAMMVASLSTGVKVVFEEMKRLKPPFTTNDDIRLGSVNEAPQFFFHSTNTLKVHCHNSKVGGMGLGWLHIFRW